jgi:hypothetical protein
MAVVMPQPQRVAAENFRFWPGEWHMTYTLADYEAAKAAVDAEEDRFARYDGNNPEKYSSGRRAAQEHLALVEADLKRCAMLPVSEAEQISAELDRQYPSAASSSIVTHEGVRYQRLYEAESRSNSGKTVRKWRRRWKRLG